MSEENRKTHKFYMKVWLMIVVAMVVWGGATISLYFDPRVPDALLMVAALMIFIFPVLGFIFRKKCPVCLTEFGLEYYNSKSRGYKEIPYRELHYIGCIKTFPFKYYIFTDDAGKDIKLPKHQNKFTLSDYLSKAKKHNICVMSSNIENHELFKKIIEGKANIKLDS